MFGKFVGIERELAKVQKKLAQREWIQKFRIPLGDVPHFQRRTESVPPTPAPPTAAEKEAAAAKERNQKSLRDRVYYPDEKENPVEAQATDSEERFWKWRRDRSVSRRRGSSVRWRPGRSR